MPPALDVPGGSKRKVTSHTLQGQQLTLRTMTWALDAGAAGALTLEQVGCLGDHKPAAASKDRPGKGGRGTGQLLGLEEHNVIPEVKTSCNGTAQPRPSIC